MVIFTGLRARRRFDRAAACACRARPEADRNQDRHSQVLGIITIFAPP